MTGAIPLISAIVASTVPLDAAPPAVGTLVRQARNRPVQILVAICDDRTAPPSWITADPELILVRLPSATTLPKLIAAALGQARAELIGILDARCDLDEDWVTAALTAHARPDPVIGGAVEPGVLRGLAAWAAYFTDYGRFMQPHAGGETMHVPGINVTFKRWALTHGREYVEGEFWKSYWCRRLQASGIKLVIDPSMIVHYQRMIGVRDFLRERFHHGRCFAAMRRPELRPAAHAALLLGAPALPLLFCGRILGAVLPKRRRLGSFVRAFPVIVLCTVAWAFGELYGYAAGGGNSCEYVR